jgi:ABC-type branched-subunit amino acid transport system substrate-binding protein
MNDTENNDIGIGNREKRRGRALCLAAAASALSIGLAACASGHASSSGQGVATVAVLSSFTGADTGYGQEGISGCIPAVDLINAAGGVVHHKLSCQAFDDRSDPADAVPEAHKILANTPLLLMSLGSGGNTAPAVVPLFNAAKVTVFSETGQSLFNVNHYSYYWRDVPVDASQGYAMAIATRMLGYSHPAAVFGQNVSSQGSLPSFVQGMKLLGHPVADTVLIPTSAPSYTTQVAAIQSAHADAVVGEIDPGSAATFTSELKQVFGHLPPLVSDQAADEAPFLKAVGGAVGAATLRQRLTLVLPVASSTGPGFLAFRKALLSSATPDKTTYVTDSYSAADYDAVTLTALAADEAKSLVSANYERYLMPIANGVPGAIVVHTYAEGVAALAKGKKIHYVGASGPISFDRYHNWEPGYVLTQLTPGGVKDLRLVPNSVLRQLELGQHASVG